MMTVRRFTEKNRESWDRYVQHCPASTCYHLSGWKDLIEKTFGHKTFYLIASGPEEKIRGILPLVHLRSFLFGSFMVSLPYVNYGGICAEDPESQGMLLREAIEIADAEHAEHIEFRHTTPLLETLPVKTVKVSMRLPLPGNPEELWKGFSSNLRRKIRKPQKEGFSWTLGREEELDAFYAVFSTNMRDLGTPVYARQFFRNLLHDFPETTWIATVRNKEGRPAASGFLVGFRDTVEIPWVSSLRCYNHLYANLFLYWNLLKFVCERGYRVFDFGRSTVGEGTYHFKEQWGAKPFQLYWHYWVRNGRPLPELNPGNPKYRLAIRLWKTFPVGLTRLMGPSIVRNLP